MLGLCEEVVERLRLSRHLHRQNNAPELPFAKIFRANEPIAHIQLARR
jgi:hypothetical protein